MADRGEYTGEMLRVRDHELAVEMLTTQAKVLRAAGEQMIVAADALDEKAAKISREWAD